MTLLTVDDFRLFVSTSLTDDALQILLDAAEIAIERELGGPVGSATEVVDGGLSMITLRRRAASVTTVVESIDSVDTTLATDDWRIRLDARTLSRLGTGTNASARWGTLASITYVPEDDEADRKRAQRALVELDINYSPGITSEQIGAWMEQHSSTPTYQQERAAILASLWPSDGLDFA